MQVHDAEKEAGPVRDKCSGLWRTVSHCLVYTVVAFFAVIVVYYVVMRVGARPAFIPGSGKYLLLFVFAFTKVVNHVMFLHQYVHFVFACVSRITLYLKSYR